MRTTPDAPRWGAYLNHGIRLMESAYLKGSYAGRCSSLQEARRVFAECALQEEEYDIQTLAHFRLAQCVSRFDRKIAAEWVALGHDRIESAEDALTPHARAQCFLLEGTVLEIMGLLNAALEATTRAWKVVALLPESHRLSGNITYRLGQLHREHGRQLGLRRKKALREACDWFLTACRYFGLLSDPDIDDHRAYAAACGYAGTTAQLLSGYKYVIARVYLRHAEKLLASHARMLDVEAAYWRNRAVTAFRLLRPFRGLWFLLRSLRSRLALHRKQQRGHQDERSPS